MTKKVHMTLNLPYSLVKDLHLYIPPRKISKFISETVAEALAHQKEEMAKNFKEAALDEERIREISFWDSNTVGDGLDETNLY